MSKKWVKVDPATIKVGDRVRTKAIDRPDAYDFTVIERGRQWIGIFALGPDRTWYVRKPKPAKYRPDEPPVGSFFRVERTGLEYVRMDNDEFGYVRAVARGCYRWVTITEPGDTITILELTEVGDKRDADA